MAKIGNRPASRPEKKNSFGCGNKTKRMLDDRLIFSSIFKYMFVVARSESKEAIEISKYIMWLYLALCAVHICPKV